MCRVSTLNHWQKMGTLIIRTALAITVLLCGMTELRATQSRPERNAFLNGSPGTEFANVFPSRDAIKVAKLQPNTELQVTSETEVMVDARPCKYSEVPRGAKITMLELAPDRQTILRIHFTTGK